MVTCSPHGIAISSVDSGAATIIDVRPISEYRRGHIPGALNVPLRDLPQRLEEIPRDQEVIAYCRGQLCVMADAAVNMLNQAGFHVRRTDEDIPTWERAGLPIARQAANGSITYPQGDRDRAGGAQAPNGADFNPQGG